MDIDGEGSANDSGDPSLSSDVSGVLKVETSAVATTTTGDKNAEEIGRFEAVVASPYDAQLHIDNISGASTAESREEARSLMHSLMAMPEEIWLAWLHDRQAALNGSVKDIDAVLDLIQLYRSSFLDGLSIQIRIAYAKYIVSLFCKSRGRQDPSEATSDMEGDGDPAVQEEEDDNTPEAAIFDASFVREHMAYILDEEIRNHLAEGQKIWLILHRFELDQFKSRPPSQESIEYMRSLYLQRLTDLHLQAEETKQLYSSFVSSDLQAAYADYEAAMTAAQQVTNATTKIVSPRERHEQSLGRARFSETQYIKYIDWELEVQQPDARLLRSLFHRALGQHPASITLWTRFFDVQLRCKLKPRTMKHADVLTAEVAASMSKQLVWALPANGSALALALQAMEANAASDEVQAFVAEQYQAASGGIRFTSVEDTVQGFTAFADIERHACMDPSNLYAPTEELVALLQHGSRLVKTLSPETGDPQMRLERYLLRLYERCDMEDSMSALLQQLSIDYPQSAAALVLRTEYLTRKNAIKDARQLFETAGKTRYDYPEFVFDAWTAFEHREGSASDLQRALMVSAREMTFVDRRRRQAAKKLLAAQQPSIALSQETGDEVTSSAANVVSAKRDRDDEHSDPGQNKAKKSATGATDPTTTDPGPTSAEMPLAEVKRDRENSTVLVGGLLQEASDKSLRTMFRDCGSIREVKINHIGDRVYATVEFTSKECVPAALTKDKKRIDGEEISVQLDWKSTVFVTNFPDTLDATALQQLFAPFGEIFEVRWPSKRFNSSRRFAYVQYTSNDAAVVSLSLNGRELEAGSGRRLQVKLSDPQRKQVRTDADADQREVYITNLPRHLRNGEAELRRLFSPYGDIRGVRIPSDTANQTRGFAFVEFESPVSAQSALSMNNHEFLKHRLAVILADSKVKPKHQTAESGQGRLRDESARSVRIQGLAAGAQEPLLQQYFDKFAPTQRVQIDGEQATVTFKSAADQARLILAPPLLEFDGQTLSIIAESAPAAQRPATSSDTAFRPRAFKKERGRRLLQVKSVPAAASGTPNASANTASASTAAAGRKTQDDFRAMLVD